MTAISSKKAEKQLEREIARKKRKLQKTTAFDVFNIIFLLILAFIVIVPFYYTIVRSFLTQQEFIMNGTTLGTTLEKCVVTPIVTISANWAQKMMHSEVNTLWRCESESRMMRSGRLKMPPPMLRKAAMSPSTTPMRLITRRFLSW